MQMRSKLIRKQNLRMVVDFEENDEIVLVASKRLTFSKSGMRSPVATIRPLFSTPFLTGQLSCRMSFP